MKRNKINNEHKKGFTLVELLVVISVIGILAGIALVSFTGAQKQARDTQRKSDIKQYQLSLENFANKGNSLYPQASSPMSCSATLCTYLGQTNCPQDPRYLKDASYDYKYQSDGSSSDGSAVATKYVLWTKLENVGSGVKYWVVCSGGKTGEMTSVPTGGSGGCPI